MNSWTAWQPWVIGIIAMAVMLWFMARALFADKARGRPRCLRCAHPFVESQGLTCTECGWTARRPGDLLRTRRHWGKAGFALAVMLVGATTENPAFSVNSALLSRCRVVPLRALDDAAIADVVRRALSDV